MAKMCIFLTVTPAHNISFSEVAWSMPDVCICVSFLCMLAKLLGLKRPRANFQSIVQQGGAGRCFNIMLPVKDGMFGGGANYNGMTIWQGAKCTH
jgi:hypothetical protein